MSRMTVRVTTQDLDKITARKNAVSKKKQEIIDGLPHLYGRKWYRWARAFFETKNKNAILCAANQISKSSTQIRKCIHWATATKLWPELWKQPPKVFWYLYPSQDVATVEFEKKWLPEFMPRGKYREDPTYGWRVEYEKKHIKAIHFNSGVTVYFKTYTQNVETLQTGTVDAIFCDEELVEDLYSELRARLFASDGYFSMVFTATLNQEMWYRAIEGQGTEELFPDWFKMQVTMYDCLLYEDGSLGGFTEERIRQIEATCKSKAEIQRRVHGRFITESGRKFHAFDPSRHYVQPHDITNWRLYGAADIGSGGREGHPGAICFVAVRPDYREGRVFMAWRGDHVQTTAGDIYNRFVAMRGDKIFNMQIYDQQSKDFGTIASRAGDSFFKAEKSHELGEEIINTLFAHDMMKLFDGDDEIRKLGVELNLLLKSTPKVKAKDDLADAFRYALTQIPWDWSAIKVKQEAEDPLHLADRPFSTLSDKEKAELEIMERRGIITRKDSKDTWQETEDEFAYWNDQYGN
jgi:phage terminase large subunit-like protein